MIVRYDPNTGNIRGTVIGNLGPVDFDEPVIEVPNDTDISGMMVDTETLALVEDTEGAQYESVMQQIENAVEKYGAYWTYKRLRGETPDAMPAPLQSRPSVPDRDPDGGPAERAVADWMSRYEDALDSL